MYEQFYGLSADPFRLAPDPRFCFRHRSYARAQAYMDHALGQGEGFIMVTGRPGTGKTTLVEQFIAESPPNSLTSGCLLSTQIGADDLLRMVAYAFELNGQGLDKATLLYRFEQLLIEIRESGRQALLIIDEAQNLTPRALEELRLLTNLRLKYQPLLQVFLVGQEKLQRFLNSPEMEQLRQRLLATCQLDPLNLEETHAYVEHRLRCAGWNADPHLAKEVFPLVHRFSEGYPRYINRACSRILLYGAVEGKHELCSADIAHALLELCHERVGPQDTVDVESPSIRTPTMGLLHAAREGGEWVSLLSSEERAFIGKPDAKMPGASFAPAIGAPLGAPPNGLPPEEARQIKEEPAFWDAYAQAQMPGPDAAPGLPEAGDGESDWRESLYQRRAPAKSDDAPEQATASTEAEATDADPAKGKASAPKAREFVPARGDDFGDDALPAIPIFARRRGAGLHGAGAMVMRHRLAALGLVLFGALILHGLLSGYEGGSEGTDNAVITSAAQRPKFGPPKPADGDLRVPAKMVPDVPLSQALAAIGPGGLMPAPRVDNRPRELRRPTRRALTAPSSREPEFADRAGREIPASNIGPGPQRFGQADAETPPPVGTGRPGDRSLTARSAGEDAGTTTPGDPGEGLAHAEESAGGGETTKDAQVSQPLAGVHRPSDSRTADAPTASAAPAEPHSPPEAGPLGEEATGSGRISDPADPRKNRIEHLIALAEAAFEEHRLTIPAKASAYDYYREVLELDPENTRATEGIGRVVRRYQTLAAGRIERKRYAEARQFIRRGLRVHPGDEKLLTLREEVRTRTRESKHVNKAKKAEEVAGSQNKLIPARNPQPFIVELSTPAQKRQEPEGLLERIKDFFSGPRPQTTGERFGSDPGD